MVTEQTIEKLMNLRLAAMAGTFQEQRATPAMSQLAFDERFGLIVDAEWLARENRRLQKTLKDARLKLPAACVEDIEYPAQRQLDRAVVRQLATCRWIEEHHNVVVTGMTGTGKTYLACALAQQACRKGYRAIYRRAPRLLDEIALARADGSYVRLLAKIARIDVLIIDDWGLTPLRDQDRRDLLEVLDDRYATRSTILTSQLPPSKWHDYLGDPSSADAICDRVLHNAHRLVLKGPSRRKEKDQEKN